MSAYHPRYDGKRKLSDIDPGDTDGLKKKDATQEAQELLEHLFKLHYVMYAENRRSLLVVLQGIDGSGKDGSVRHIASGLNPQGLTVRSFKVPNDVEEDHDYLWRVHAAAPRRGEIAIFNRSHYEEVILPIVHPAVIEREPLPKEVLRKKSLVEQRYRQINDFERMLEENGTVVLKFLLLISKDEQEKRLQERLNDPTKQWKFSMKDLAERNFWNTYMTAYQKMIENTHTNHAPWHLIPGDKKWYRNLLISRIIVERLEQLKMKFPTLDETVQGH